MRQRVRSSGIHFALLFLVGSLSTSCGEADRTIASTASYEPPSEHRIIVETVVALPFDSAWDDLIRRLSESSFRVSTLEKASRFVALEVHRSSDLATNANQPSRFVDCGRTVRTYSEGGEEERFEYAVAQSSRHKEASAVEGGTRVSDVERRVDLEARATIYLQPEGPDRTRITVKTSYELKIEITIQAAIVSSDSGKSVAPAAVVGPRVESVRFTTFRPGRDKRSGGLACRATGDLEHALIALANPAAAI